MTFIDYDHQRNIHTVEGARQAFQSIFSSRLPGSVLDVGCGTGAWLKAALDSGVADVFGIDGIAIPASALLVPANLFKQQDLTQRWALGRRFDTALCLEVAEHLDVQHASALIDGLTNHADTIVFSAACPNQLGQHHVKCQWPSWWQQLFNVRGFVCEDRMRWLLWDIDKIEPWYRQNLFIATRDKARAGSERRIHSVIHPTMLRFLVSPANAGLCEIENGSQPALWYLKCTLSALARKASRRIRGRR